MTTPPEPPPSFATSTDLATLRPGIDTALADLVLELVSADIRAGVDWPVTDHTGSETTTRTGCAVMLPALHVTAVTSVTADGVVLTEGDDYTWNEDGVVKLVRAADVVTVEYRAGYPADEVPGVFRSVCLDHALRRLDSPGGVRSWQLGDESYSYGTSADPGADARLNPYRLVAAA